MPGTTFSLPILTQRSSQKPILEGTGSCQQSQRQRNLDGSNKHCKQRYECRSAHTGPKALVFQAPVNLQVPRTQLNGAPPPPPGLEVQSPLCSPRGIPVKAAPVRLRSQLALAFTSSGASFAPTPTPPLQPQVSTTQVGTHSALSSHAHKRSASTALAGTHSAIGADPDRPNLLDSATFTMRTATLCIINFVSPFAMESRPSAQESHTYHSRHLRTISRSHLTGSQ